MFVFPISEYIISLSTYLVMGGIMFVNKIENSYMWYCNRIRGMGENKRSNVALRGRSTVTTFGFEIDRGQFSKYSKHLRSVAKFVLFEWKYENKTHHYCSTALCEHYTRRFIYRFFMDHAHYVESESRFDSRIWWF